MGETWYAHINDLPGPDPKPKLIVSGTIKKVPGIQHVLSFAEPQGINPDVVLLELKEEPAGKEKIAEETESVRYEMPVGKVRPTKVQIRRNGSHHVVEIQIEIAQ